MSSTKLQRPVDAPTQYTPLGSTLAREVAEMGNRMRRLFREPARSVAPGLFGADFVEEMGWVPLVDVSESPTEFTVLAELPGMKAKDVDVAFDDGTLTLRGERDEKHEEKDRRYHVWERSYGTFLRTFTFPVAIDDANIRAEHKDGLLEVHLPKLPGSKPQGRRIDVVEKA